MVLISETLLTEAARDLAALQRRDAAARRELAEIARTAEEIRRNVCRALGEETHAMTDEDLARNVCLELGYDLDRLRRRDRTQGNVRARAAVWSVLSERYEWSAHRIAAAFHRDHGTVLHALT